MVIQMKIQIEIHIQLQIETQIEIRTPITDANTKAASWKQEVCSKSCSGITDAKKCGLIGVPVFCKKMT